MKSIPKLIVFIAAAVAFGTAFSAPDGYLQVASTDDVIWYMHPDVSVRGMKKDPSDINVLADIWVEEPGKSGRGEKEAFNCNEPGVTFDVNPSGDGGYSRGTQRNYTKGSVGYALWGYACGFSKRR